MTAAVLDLRPKYRGEELDRLAKEVAEALSGMNKGSVAEIALTTRRLLQMAAEREDEDILVCLGQIVVHRSGEDELRVFLDLGVVEAIRE